MSAKLGPFELLDQIGRSATTVVFRAFDPSINGEIALKLLDEEVARQNPNYVQSFLNEAQNATAVSHPNLAQVYSVGEVEGNYYVAMELLSGRSLADIIRETGVLAEADALEIAIQVTDALREAYSKRMIHGDIKPQNIFITTDGTAKLLDLGLGRLANVNTLVAPDGVSWGSAFYVSPERASRKPDSFRNDVYSLGATLFHALTGRPPFEAKTLTELTQKRLGETAPGVRKLNPHVSSKTEQILAKALNKTASQRHLDYSSLIEELNAAWTKASGRSAKGHPQPAAGPGETASAAGGILGAASNNKLLWIAIGCGAATLILGIMVVVLLLRGNKAGPAQGTPAAMPIAVATATPFPTPTPRPTATPVRSTPTPVAYSTPVFVAPVLEAFNFATLATGGETSVLPRVASNKISGTTISRGGGLTPKTGFPMPGAFASLGSGVALSYGEDLAEAIDSDQYYEFSVIPASGATLSLNALEFYPFFEHASKPVSSRSSGYSSSKGPKGRGAGITYSTDGVNFSKGIAATGRAAEAPSKFTVSLIGQTPLQSATTKITFRIYLFGSAPEEYTGIGRVQGLSKPQIDDIILTGSAN